jgi:4-hydroxy-tetrahydrodipicolinate reductase
MKLALIGNGAMGQLVAAEAIKAGDEIACTMTSIDQALDLEQFVGKLSGCDVAVDFSVGGAVQRNIEACVRANVPVVEGTTGWKDREGDVKRIVTQQGGALVYGANFSIGVNVFYRIVEHSSALFARVESYAPFIEEAHHARKRDAPSGTAWRLQELMSKHLRTEIPTSSTRAGYIPGTHRVGFDSEADQITLTHTARSRQGFAAGALLAAHWIVGRRGVFEFGEVVDQILLEKV